MQPMYAKDAIVTTQGNYIVLTFENSSQMTQVKISKATADKLANSIQRKA